MDFDFLVSLYKKQKGRCFYSNLPLIFGNSKFVNWVISLERIDPLKGYTKNNVCLICCEFNTGNKTSTCKTISKGSCGWSIKNLNFLLNKITTFEISLCKYNQKMFLKVILVWLSNSNPPEKKSYKRKKF